MKTFVEENYPLDNQEYKNFASFLTMKGQTESTERDLFAWLLDNYLATQNKDLWVYTEDKALRGSIKRKAFDLSVIRWSEKKPTERIREHIMEFKSERHGKFRNSGSVESFLKGSLLLDIHKMWRHFASEGEREGTKYWECVIFYSFFLGEVRVPEKYATYGDDEKSSKKGISEDLEEIGKHYAECLNNFKKEMANNEKNTKGRTFILTKKETDEYGKRKSEEKTVKFKVNTEQSIERNIAVGEHRGISLRSDIYLMSIDFDI